MPLKKELTRRKKENESGGSADRKKTQERGQNIKKKNLIRRKKDGRASPSPSSPYGVVRNQHLINHPKKEMAHSKRNMEEKRLRRDNGVVDLSKSSFPSLCTPPVEPTGRRRGRKEMFIFFFFYGALLVLWESWWLGFLQLVDTEIPTQRDNASSLQEMRTIGLHPSTSDEYVTKYADRKNTGYPSHKLERRDLEPVQRDSFSRVLCFFLSMARRLSTLSLPSSPFPCVSSSTLFSVFLSPSFLVVPRVCFSVFPIIFLLFFLCYKRGSFLLYFRFPVSPPLQTFFSRVFYCKRSSGKSAVRKIRKKENIKHRLSGPIVKKLKRKRPLSKQEEGTVSEREEEASAHENPQNTTVFSATRCRILVPGHRTSEVQVAEKKQTPQKITLRHKKVGKIDHEKLNRQEQVLPPIKAVEKHKIKKAFHNTTHSSKSSRKSKEDIGSCCKEQSHLEIIKTSTEENRCHTGNSPIFSPTVAAALLTWYQELLKTTCFSKCSTETSHSFGSTSFLTTKGKRKKKKIKNPPPSLVLSDIVDDAWLKLDAFLHYSLPDYQYIQGSGASTDIDHYYYSSSGYSGSGTSCPGISQEELSASESCCSLLPDSGDKDPFSPLGYSTSVPRSTPRSTRPPSQPPLISRGTSFQSCSASKSLPSGSDHNNLISSPSVSFDLSENEEEEIKSGTPEEHNKENPNWSRNHFTSSLVYLEYFFHLVDESYSHGVDFPRDYPIPSDTPKTKARGKEEPENYKFDNSSPLNSGEHPSISGSFIPDGAWDDEEEGFYSFTSSLSFLDSPLESSSIISRASRSFSHESSSFMPSTGDLSSRSRCVGGSLTAQDLSGGNEEEHLTQEVGSSHALFEAQPGDRVSPLIIDTTPGNSSPFRDNMPREKSINGLKDSKLSVRTNGSLTVGDSPNSLGSHKGGRTPVKGKAKKREGFLPTPLMNLSQRKVSDKELATPLSAMGKKPPKSNGILAKVLPSSDSTVRCTRATNQEGGGNTGIGGGGESKTSSFPQENNQDRPNPPGGRYSEGSPAESANGKSDSASVPGTSSSPTLGGKKVIPILSSVTSQPQSPRKKVERLVSIEEQQPSSRRAPLHSSRSAPHSSSMESKPLESVNVPASSRRPILSLGKSSERGSATKPDMDVNASISGGGVSPRAPTTFHQGFPSIMTLSSSAHTGSTTPSTQNMNMSQKAFSPQGGSAGMSKPLHHSKVSHTQSMDEAPHSIPAALSFSNTPASRSAVYSPEPSHENKDPTPKSGRGVPNTSTPRQQLSSSYNTMCTVAAVSRRTVHQMEANPHVPATTSAQFFPPQSSKSRLDSSPRKSSDSSSNASLLDPKNLKLEIIDDFRDEEYKAKREEEEECASAASSMNSSYCGSPHSRDGTPHISPSNTGHFMKMASVHFAGEDDDEVPFVYDRVQEEAAVSRFFSVGSLNFEGIKQDKKVVGEDHVPTPLGPRPFYSSGTVHFPSSAAAERSSSKLVTFFNLSQGTSPSKEAGLGDSMATSASFLAVQKTTSQKTMTLTPIPDLNEDRHSRNEIIQQIISRASVLGGDVMRDANGQHVLNNYALSWDPPLCGEEVSEETSLSSHPFTPSMGSTSQSIHKSVKFSLPGEHEVTNYEIEDSGKLGVPSSPLAGANISPSRRGKQPPARRPPLRQSSSIKGIRSGSHAANLKQVEWIQSTNELLLKAASSKRSTMQCRLLSLYEAFFLDRTKKKWLVDDAVLAKCLEYVGLMGYEHPQLQKDRAKCQPSMWSSSASIPSPLTEVASSVPGAESVRVTNPADLCVDGVLRRYRLSHKASCQPARNGVETTFLSSEEAMRWVNSKEYVIGAILLVCASAMLPSQGSSSGVAVGGRRLSTTTSASARMPLHRVVTETGISGGQSARAVQNQHAEEPAGILPCIPPNIHPIFWVALYACTFYPQWGDFSTFSNLWETQVRLVLTPASTSRQKSIRVIEDGLLFSSDREGGNLAHVERIIPKDVVMVGEDLESGSNSASLRLGSGGIRSGSTPSSSEPVYRIWLEPDLNSDKRIWFRFSIAGAVEGRLLRLRLMNAAPHLKLYKTNGMRPVWRDGLTQVGWASVEECEFELVDDGLNGELSFSILPRSSTETIQVAFCAPYTYADLLCHLVHWHGLVKQINAHSSISHPLIRFEERLLGYTPEGRKQHVLLITSPINPTAKNRSQENNKSSFNALFPKNGASSTLKVSLEKSTRKSVTAASSRKNSASFSLCSTVVPPVSSRGPASNPTKHADPVVLSPRKKMASPLGTSAPPKSGKASTKVTRAEAEPSSLEPVVVAEPMEVLSPFSNFSTGKKVVLISGRVHPGEITASHGLHGLVTYLLSNDPGAVVLRNHFIFLVVPMLNPDGVSRGHSRMDQFGVNLNRSYNKPDPFMEPTIYQLKKLFEGLLSAYGERFFIYIDFHSHASQSTSFMFGNELPQEVNHWNKAFARLVEIHSRNLFEYPVCRFSKGHMSTKDGASRVLFGLSLIHSYTIELPHFTDRTMFTEQFLPMLTGRFGVDDILHTFRSGSSPSVGSVPISSADRNTINPKSGDRSVSTTSAVTNSYGSGVEGSMVGPNPSMVVSSRRQSAPPQKNWLEVPLSERGGQAFKIPITNSHMELSNTFRGNSLTMMGIEGVSNRSVTPVSPGHKSKSDGSSPQQQGGALYESNAGNGRPMGGTATTSARKVSYGHGMSRGNGDGGRDYSLGSGKRSPGLQPIFFPSVLRQSAVVGISCMLALLDYANLGAAIDRGNVDLSVKASGGKGKGRAATARVDSRVEPTQYTGESSLLKQFGGMEKVLKSVRVVEKRTRAVAAAKAAPGSTKKKKKKKKVEK